MLPLQKKLVAPDFHALSSITILIHCMSEPFHSLQDLYRDRMPVTRSQGQSSQRGRDSSGRRRGRLDPLSRPLAPTSLTGPSRSPDSTFDQSTNAPMHTTESLDPHISVERLHIVPLENDAYWAIQLNPVSVRIYSPSAGTGRVTCSCVEFRRTQTPCAHLNVRLLDFSQTL